MDNTEMNPKIIAEYVLCKYSWKYGISNLKLQEILYFIALAYFKKTKESLYDEPFWLNDAGIMLKSIYEKYMRYAAYPIAIPEVEPTMHPKAIKLISITMDKIFPNLYNGELTNFIGRDGGVWDTYYYGMKRNLPVNALELDLTFFDE